MLALDNDELGTDRWTVAFASFLLGNIFNADGDAAAAETLFDAAVTIAREAGAAHITGLALLGPMNLAWRAGDYARARALIDESVGLVRPYGKWILATALSNLCVVSLSQGQPEVAAAAGREGAACAHETADTRALTWCVSGLASVAGAQRQFDRAARLWGAAVGISESIGAPLPYFVREILEPPGVRQALGDERFAAAWTEGRQMTPDAVVAYVLSEDG